MGSPRTVASRVPEGKKETWAMCRMRTTTLDPDASSAAKARSFLRASMRRWEITEPQDSALLLTSELVTNAVVHARTRVALTVAIAKATLEVAVADRNMRLPRPRYAPEQAPPTSTPLWLEDGGRGLLIVNALADEWGIAEERHGKHVWFRLAVDETWPHSTSCPCGGADLHDAVSLGSGRRVRHIAGPWDGPA